MCFTHAHLCLTTHICPGIFTFKEIVIANPQLPAKLELHKVYEVPCLNGSSDNSLMFTREDMVERWQYAFNQESDYFVQGPPGIGKTLLSKGLCTYSHFTEGKDVCFVQLSLQGCNVVILQKVDHQFGFQFHVLVKEWTVEALSEAITQKSPNVSMIVVDGVQHNSFERSVQLATSVADWQNERGTRCQIIFVTSQQVDFTKKHQMGAQLQEHLRPLHPPPVSWTLEEYSTACHNKQLWCQIAKTVGDKFHFECSADDKLNALKEKFFYCGGSARWMFNLSIMDIIGTIDSKVEELFLLPQFLSGSAGMSSQLAVNTLYQQFRGSSSSSSRISFFISEYAMRRIVERTGDEAANFMWNWATASNHPPVRGLAYEGKCITAWKNSTISLDLKYLDTLTMTSPNITTTSKGRHTKIKVVQSKGQAQSILSLDAQGILNTSHLKPGPTDIVIIPGKWNQECFDFAFIQGKEIYCVQCTLQTSHSRSISAIGDIIKACRDKSINVEDAHLVAFTDKAKFNFEKAEKFAAGIKKIMCWWAKFEPS